MIAATFYKGMIGDCVVKHGCASKQTHRKGYPIAFSKSSNVKSSNRNSGTFYVENI